MSGADAGDDELARRIVARGFATAEQVRELLGRGGRCPLESLALESGLLSADDLQALRRDGPRGGRAADLLVSGETPLRVPSDDAWNRSSASLDGDSRLDSDDGPIAAPGASEAGSGPVDSRRPEGPSDRVPVTRAEAGASARLGPGAAPIVVDTRLELVSERVLGSGGMGVVYLVRDVALDRLAALKVLRGGSNERRAERFRREARITARLDHPGVPPVFEVGRAASGDDYLLMRFVDGEPLTSHIARLAGPGGRRPGPEDARVRALLDALARAGEAVAYAHSRGVVHRDLKPDNVMIGSFGEVLVMDWGLARDLEAADDDVEATRAPGARAHDPVPGLTHADQILGTPGYMPPEQAKGGGDVDPRADVWSLGAMLVAVLTGRAPVEGDGLLEVVSRTLAGEVRLPGPDCPPALRAIAARALALDREARYPTASAFVTDLRAWLEGRSVSVHEDDGWTRARRAVRAAPGPFAAATVAVLLAPLAGAGVVLAPAWAEARARARTCEEARVAFSGAWSALGDAAVVDSAARTARALQALAAGQRWSALAPEDPGAVAGRARAAGALLDLAVATGQWDLALEATTWTEHPAARRAGVDAARSAEAERRAAVAQAVLERAERGVLRREPEGLTTAVFTLVREADEGVARLLAARLTAMAGELRAGRPPEDRFDAARVSAEALGRLDAFRALAVPALREYLEVEVDELRAVPVGMALARLGGDDALAAVLGARRRFGANGPFARQLGRALPSLAPAAPTPPGAPPGGPAAWTDEDSLALRQRALDKRARGDTRGAIADLTLGLERAPRDVTLLSDRAVMRLEAGDARAALADFDRALAVDPRNAQVWANRAVARRKLGDGRGALEDLDRAVALDPAAPLIRITRGALRQAEGDLRGAVADLTDAVLLDPQMAEAWHNRGRAHQALGDDRAAIADFDRALELDPRQATTWSNRGAVRARMGDAAGGLADTTRAVEVSPRFAHGWYQRGSIRQLQGDLRGAREDFDRALELDGGLIAARYQRAQVRAQRGDVAGAIADLEEFLRLAPATDVRRAEAQEILARLRGAPQ